MAYTTVTYTFSNNTTADATQVNQNFTDLINGLSDGTKDISINALTAAGTATLNGNVNLGNSSSDDLTITAALAGSVSVKANATYEVGSSTLGLLSIYFGATGSYTVRLKASASQSATYTLTLPTTAGSADTVPSNDGSGNLSWLNVKSGTYTPTATGVTNIVTGGITIRTCMYLRIGSIVQVSGNIDIDPTSTGNTQFGLTLPISSDFTVSEDAAGTIGVVNGSTDGVVTADTTNNRLDFLVSMGTASNSTFCFTAMYVIK